MLTKKYPSTTRIVGIVLRSYIPNSGGERKKKFLTQSPKVATISFLEKIRLKAFKIGL